MISSRVPRSPSRHNIWFHGQYGHRGATKQEYGLHRGVNSSRHLLIVALRAKRQKNPRDLEALGELLVS
jgi:hypothetical protein